MGTCEGQFPSIWFIQSSCLSKWWMEIEFDKRKPTVPGTIAFLAISMHWPISNIFSTGSLLAIRLSGQISSSFNLISKTKQSVELLIHQLPYAFQQSSLNLCASEFSRKYLQEWTTVHIGQPTHSRKQHICKMGCCIPRFFRCLFIW